MGLHTPNPSKINTSSKYALFLTRIAGFRQNQVVRVENIRQEEGTLTAITSSGRVEDGVRMDKLSPEACKLCLVEDFKPFKKGDVVVVFEEKSDGSDSTLVYNFKGRSSKVPNKLLKFLPS